MFALTHDEVEASGNVVEGTIFILGHSARALMDSGASHSFVSKSFACTLSQSLQSLESNMAVATVGFLLGTSVLPLSKLVVRSLLQTP